MEGSYKMQVLASVVCVSQIFFFFFASQAGVLRLANLKEVGRTGSLQPGGETELFIRYVSYMYFKA